MNTNDIPIWQKYTLSIKEASRYFRIGEKKLRRLAEEENPDANWLITRYLRVSNESSLRKSSTNWRLFDEAG